jgi:hypothetical protein
MADWAPIYPIVKKINLLPLLQPFYPLLQPPCYSSLDPTTKGGALSLPADLGQPTDVFALAGPSRARASTVSLLVCQKTSWFFDAQARWLSFGGLLVNLFVLHHERVASSLRPKPLLVCDLEHIQRQHTFRRLRWGKFVLDLLCSRILLP